MVRTRINEIKVMQDLAFQIMHGAPAPSRYDELAELARALREALDNPSGPLAPIAIAAYDEWANP
jgi:hypothetical protein